MDTALTWYKTYGDQKMLEFPCKNNAINSINTLYDSGHTIIFATARATDWHTNPEEITKQWLKNNHIKYHKLYVGRIDKELICNEEHADVFIDDNIKIATKFSQHNPNIKAFLATTDYNKNLDIPNNITRIENIQEVLNHFKIKPFYK